MALGTYSPGTLVTQVEPQQENTIVTPTSFSSGYGSSDPGFLSLAKDIIAARQQAAQQAMAAARFEEERQRELAYKAQLRAEEQQRQRENEQRAAAARNHDPNEGLAQYAQQQRLMADIANSKAQYEAAPTRIVSGAGIIPGQVMDVMAMNAAQRKAYLPNNSTNDPEKDAKARGLNMMANDAEFNSFRTRSQESLGITPSGNYGTSGNTGGAVSSDPYASFNAYWDHRRDEDRRK